MQPALSYRTTGRLSNTLDLASAAADFNSYLYANTGDNRVVLYSLSLGNSPML